jgi:N-acetylmuramoyl-L-alanine amidase
MPSSLTRGYADDAAQSFPNNTFDVENIRLALRVHRALLQVNGNHDRGVRRARFPGVLRGQNRPAILIEGGYLSNPHEARLIADPAYRQKLAEAVAKALLTGDKGQGVEVESPKAEGQQTGRRKQDADGGGQRSQTGTQPSRITHHASLSSHSA